MIKVLTFSTLYPNNTQARHGIFVEQRLRKVLALGGIEARVVAPVPWFPFRTESFGDYGRYAAVDHDEVRNDIQVSHPRYPLIPKIGMTLAPFLMALFTYFHLKKLIRDGFDFDLIDAHYFYPDGVAAAMLASMLKKPFVVTARGTDINLIPRYPIPSRLILWAARKAEMSFTVCQALKDEMVGIGADDSSIHVMRNGVDLEKFRLLDRDSCRSKYQLKGRVLLSVGHLVERKGHHLIIEAMAILPSYRLLIAGDGEEFHRLQELADRLGVSDRVTFLGALSHDELVEVYNAVDALVLASSREGWANVLLESMACGTPVVATNVWGTPEVVQKPEAGVVIPERSAQAIACGVSELMNSKPDRQATRRYAEGFSWDETVRSISERLFQIAGKMKPKKAA